MDRDDARTSPHYGELSAEQLSELERVVKDFVSNVEGAGIESLDKILPMMGHGSHANSAPATPKTPKKPKGPKK
jgi:hypothetical protein